MKNETLTLFYMLYSYYHNLTLGIPISKEPSTNSRFIISHVINKLSLVNFVISELKGGEKNHFKPPLYNNTPFRTKHTRSL